jgi:hypothetical protein
MDLAMPFLPEDCLGASRLVKRKRLKNWVEIRGAPIRICPLVDYSELFHLNRKTIGH